MARTLKVEIIGDASSLHKAFRQADDSGSRFGSTLGTLGKTAGLAIGAAGLGGLAVVLHSGISEYKQSTLVAAQTAAAIKSTGGAANVTAKQVDTLAQALLKKSGVDDETIKSSENLLLTFTAIRNEVGKGNDIFNQATKATLDMSVALGQDTKSSAIQLGKALQDPIKGITALRRVGVAFTDAQQAQIKALTESGHSMEAQKLILRELNKEFGGSAEAAGKTLPGQLNILKETFNNLAGDLVAKAVPAVTSFVTFLTQKGLPLMQEAFGKIGETIGPVLDRLKTSFEAAGPAILGVLKPLGDVIQNTLVPVFIQLQDIGTRTIQAVSKVIQENGPQLRQIFHNLGEVIQNLAKVIVPLLDFAFTKVLPVAIKILIPALVLVTDALAKVSVAVRVIGQAVEAVLIPALNAIIRVGSTVVAFLVKNLGPAFEAIVAPVKVAAGVLNNILSPALHGITAAIGGIKDGFTWLLNNAGAIFTKIAKVLPPAIAIITAPFRTLLGILDAILGAIDRFLQKVGNVIDAAGKLGSVLGKVGGVIGHIPGLQSGGPVSAGQAYIVGEKGPELFVPGMNGMIVPNLSSPNTATLGGGMGGIIVNVYNAGSVISERDLVDSVRDGLLAKQRQIGSLGFN